MSSVKRADIIDGNHNVRLHVFQGRYGLFHVFSWPMHIKNLALFITTIGVNRPKGESEITHGFKNTFLFSFFNNGGSK